MRTINFNYVASINPKNIPAAPNSGNYGPLIPSAGKFMLLGEPGYTSGYPNEFVIADQLNSIWRYANIQCYPQMQRSIRGFGSPYEQFGLMSTGALAYMDGANFAFCQLLNQGFSIPAIAPISGFYGIPGMGAQLYYGRVYTVGRVTQYSAGGGVVSDSDQDYESGYVLNGTYYKMPTPPDIITITNPPPVGVTITNYKSVTHIGFIDAFRAIVLIEQGGTTTGLAEYASRFYIYYVKDGSFVPVDGNTFFHNKGDFGQFDGYTNLYKANGNFDWQVWVAFDYDGNFIYQAPNAMPTPTVVGNASADLMHFWSLFTQESKLNSAGHYTYGPYTNDWSHFTFAGMNLPSFQSGHCVMSADNSSITFKSLGNINTEMLRTGQASATVISTAASPTPYATKGGEPLAVKINRFSGNAPFSPTPPALIGFMRFGGVPAYILQDDPNRYDIYISESLRYGVAYNGLRNFTRPISPTQGELK